MITRRRPRASESGPWKIDMTANAAMYAETSCCSTAASASSSAPMRANAGKMPSMVSGAIIASAASVRVTRAGARGGRAAEGTGRG